jgi:hypothetical protein
MAVGEASMWDDSRSRSINPATSSCAVNERLCDAADVLITIDVVRIGPPPSSFFEDRSSCAAHSVDRRSRIDARFKSRNR